jgi:hypothetical protein
MTAFVFQMQGHQFYVLNSADFTWACDLSTGHWQEWSTYQLDRWRAEGSLEIGNMRVVGDYDLAKLYELDLTAFDDAGTYLQWRLRSGPTGEFPNRFVADQLYLDMLVGVGLATGTDTDTEPQILLRTSSDDGRTWSSEMSRPLGAEAVYKKQVSFRNLGSSGQDGMRFEITVSAAVARCLQGAALRFTPLAP